MPVLSCGLVGRGVHRRSIAGIVCEAAYLVCECDAEVESEEVEVCAESSVEVRDRVSAQVVGCTCIFGGGLFRHVPVCISDIHIPHRLSFSGYAGVFLHVEGVHRESLSVERGTAHKS